MHVIRGNKQMTYYSSLSLSVLKDKVPVKWELIEQWEMLWLTLTHFKFGSALFSVFLIIGKYHKPKYNYAFKT